MTLNIEKLYNRFGDTLEYAFIEKIGDNCFDLVDELGNILAMNGDEVKVVKQWSKEEDRAILCNTFDGTRFCLSLAEYAAAFC